MCHKCTGIYTEIGPRRPWWCPWPETVLLIALILGLFYACGIVEHRAEQQVTVPAGYVIMDSDHA